LGRAVVNYQVFQPLADLNAELARKNAEIQEATLKKSQFLANMSHELRTPLNSIIGYTELVDNGTYGALGEVQQDRLRKVTRNGRVLLDLINDVLDLSRIEAGRVEARPRPVPTTDLLNSLIAEFEPQARARGLEMVRGYGKLPAMRVDEDLTRQILSNLLSNAVKYTDTGSVIVRGDFDESRHQVVLTITDTGLGIDPTLYGAVRYYQPITLTPGARARAWGWRLPTIDPTARRPVV
jgi:signal transduction histidine kinase